ncbi:SDR family NAD(P)-dependent oxidoreductase [Actinomadura madurae]|uniref:SDR family NAD(P)-dependent oxidoreductase n=1 Tax=Actinomadura madurae TaxID=1993 RepID=UPI0020267927|nr:SDR family NAD(P)-dependent oxidoreductase [Actinomadura madurae]MCP9955571.1 SDR family oxidoreductase [Actinomadura madurae]MCP9972310.1 SDR family oxidoreductase [Actinomadura madurae]MCQ0003630.1 SDR family oxidoreductase [Actinomadura madurae]MCQ0021006.1 SDR family oxidoreductase [Actinomadura madurae]URN01024.1 SDR family oxidoreductase [Actinomadura madurae]
MTGRLEGKVAIITGAGSVGPGWGNGRATAVTFAREGAHVLLVDRDKESLEKTFEQVRELGGSATLRLADVTDQQAVEAFVGACVEEHGGLDILVNNVGGSRAGGVAELGIDDWHAQLEVNLTSVFLGCKAAVPVMRSGGGGSIVNISSASGLRYTGAAQVAYASAKAAVIQLSRVSAVQYAPFGVRVNTVVPGQLHTPMVEARLAGQRAGGDVALLLQQRQARIPLGFMGDGRDTANAALFFASDESRFVTGTELVVDGGMTARCD